MKRYKTILFDLDGTLVFSEPDIWQVYERLAREAGLSISPDARRRAERYAHFYYAGLNYKADYDRLGLDGFRRHYTMRVLQEMQCDNGDPSADSGRSLEAAVNFILSRFREIERRKFIPAGTRETLVHLRERGCTLGLVTNRRADEMPVAFQMHDLARYFSFLVTSSDAANPKPDRAMFDLALARSECACEEALHVGDNFYADVAGAQACGIEPVLLDPKGLFPEAQCLVIRSLPELLNHLA